MANRLSLQAALENILGSRNVYFQPPEDLKLTYPCILYEREKGEPFRADDSLYHYVKSYNVILIDKNPDSAYPDLIMNSFKYCTFDRFYTADNLNHYSFTLFY